MKLFSKSLKPEEVINFLKENPDFFIDHPEAIEHLEIKHESGEAVSFIEKQVEFIKSKNLATSTQLKDFILNANANELLFAKVRKLISIILSAEDLEKLLIATESFFMNELGTEKCKLFFFTQEELYRVSAKRIIEPEIATKIFSKIFKEVDIFLGKLSNEIASLTFGAQAGIKEAVIGKLHSNKIAGVLILGSSVDDKYTPDQDTLFLSFIVEVLSHQIDRLIEDRVEIFLNENKILIIAKVNNNLVRNFLGLYRRKGLSPKSLARILSSLRSFFKFLKTEGKFTNDPTVGISAPKQDALLPKALDTDMIDKLLNFEPKNWIEHRDKAMMELIYSSGLRLSELCSLNLKDLLLEEQMCRVLGKGNKERLVPLMEFIKTSDGSNLIQGFKRANNILLQAEKNDGVEYSFGADLKYAKEDAELNLFSVLDSEEVKIKASLEREDFVEAMKFKSILT